MPVKKWTQVAGVLNSFYHLEANDKRHCSVNLAMPFIGGMESELTLAVEGWIKPTSYLLEDENLGSSIVIPVGAYQPGPVTEWDIEYVNSHRRMINEKLGWKEEGYEVKEKWTQLASGKNFFYHLEAKGRKCSVNLFMNLGVIIYSEVTLAVEGWIEPRSHESE